MTETLAAHLASLVAGEVREAEPLAEHTTLKVGGPAAAFVRAETVADLAAVAEVCRSRQVPWLVLGRGSNLLIADAGWPGVAVALGRGFRGVTFAVADEPVLPDTLAIGATVQVSAGAAEPMPVLARRMAEAGLAGLAYGVAIPGSVGGAVRMNAGAHGVEVREALVDVDVVRLGAAGRLERLDADALDMGYRHTALPDDAVVVRARLRLHRADNATVRSDMDQMRRWRRRTQPIGDPSCGSVFRNPEGDSAGRLIEAAGLKGFTVGGAQVNTVHANFITVAPGTTAADVHAVVRQVQARVAAVHGVTLRTEVVMVGFADTADIADTADTAGGPGPRGVERR